MSQNIIRSLVNAAEIAILIYVIIGAIRLLKTDRCPVSVIFFTIGVMSYMMSLLYWLVFEYMMPPDVRMPFAANEIGESAAFLLFATSIKASVTESSGRRFRFYARETAVAAVFTAANVCLWIAWSGEYMQDIVGGTALGYLVVIAANAARNVSIFSTRTAAVFACIWLTVSLEVVRLFAPAGSYLLIDTAANLIRILTICYGGFAAARSIRGNDPGMRAYIVSVSCFLWCTFAMYMCVEPMYFFPNIVSIMTIQMMMLSLRKAVNER